MHLVHVIQYLLRFYLLIHQVPIVMIKLLHFETFGQQHRQVIIFPFPGWQVLQEQHSLLKWHLLYILTELEEEGCAYIAVELREALVL